jgi:hypothetical protein
MEAILVVWEPAIGDLVKPPGAFSASIERWCQAKGLPPGYVTIDLGVGSVISQPADFSRPERIGIDRVTRSEWSSLLREFPIAAPERALVTELILGNWRAAILTRLGTIAPALRAHVEALRDVDATMTLKLFE